MALTINDKIVEPVPETVPEQMQKLNNWVVWKTAPSKKVNEHGEQILDKVLKRTNGASASSIDPKTWTDFHTAYSSYANGKFSGIGFVFEKENRIIGLDLDGHFEDGEPLTEIAEKICNETFVEISPSGTGAHAYFIGDMPEDFKKKYRDHEGELEIYNDGRFFTFTGVMVGQDDISKNQGFINDLVKQYFYKPPENEITYEEARTPNVFPSNEIKRKMFRNDKVKQLFDGDLSEYGNDSSAADMALANHLAFWTGKNPNQMDDIFRESGLYREKWDKVHSSNGDTYGEMTIKEAIRSCQNVYKQSVENPRESKDHVWDEIVTFDNEDVLPFPKDIFPDWLEDYIDQVAQSTQTPREMAAMGAFTALSIAMTGKFNVEVYDGWVEPLNTYLLTLMPPSSKKSQVFKAMMLPIQDFQKEKSEQMKVAVAQSKHDLDVKEKTINGLKTRISQPKKGDDIRELEQELADAIEDFETTEQVHSPTYIADDTTPEMLTQLLQNNNERMGIVSAEGGIFSTIKGKYSEVSNYDVYLSAYSGDMMSVHRLSREAVQLNEPLISIGVFAQPSVIQNLPREFFDRGLMARFLYSLPKDNRGERSIRPKRRDPVISDTYYNNMKTLLNINASGVTLSLTRNADNLLYLLQEEIEHRQGDGKDLSENDDIGAWSGKLIGQLMRLAGLLHMSKTMSYISYEIEEDTMHIVEKLKDYFISHMKKAFNISSEDPFIKDSEYLLSKILEMQEDNAVKQQSLWQKVKWKFKTAKDIEDPLKLLEDRGYIKVVDLKTESSKKTAKTIILNPLTAI